MFLSTCRIMFVQLMRRCWQILLIIVQELQVVFEIMYNVLSEMFGGVA